MQADSLKGPQKNPQKNYKKVKKVLDKRKILR